MVCLYDKTEYLLLYFFRHLFLVIFKLLVLIHGYEYLWTWKIKFLEGFNPLPTSIQIKKYSVILCGWLCCLLARALSCQEGSQILSLLLHFYPAALWRYWLNSTWNGGGWWSPGVFSSRCRCNVCPGMTLFFTILIQKGILLAVSLPIPCAPGTRVPARLLGLPKCRPLEGGL